MDNTRNIEEFGVKYFLKKRWLLNLYLIKYDASENVTNDLVVHILDKCLQVLEDKYLSNEFQYFKTGMAFLHFGRRGIDLSVWHVGTWGNTFEYFSCTWYCYERNYTDMELLDNAEPILSQYETQILIEEIRKINLYDDDNPSQSSFRKFFLHQ